MKVAELKVNETLNKHGMDGNLISVYFYDKKTVYFMTNVCDTIKWVEEQQKV